MVDGPSPSPLKEINLSNSEILDDYRVGYMSRIASLVGRKEVLSGKAKFGIFGDGKELAQIAMAKAFKKGDWRAGYYRDQTFMFASGATTIRKFFAQLYADTNPEHEPASHGRQMNSHFASRFVDENGNWLNQIDILNTTADASPTACQMPRLLGLGYASKLYRENKDLQDMPRFSSNGNEIAFGTIGNASTSEGLFWETLNAAGVLQVPLLISVWDDDYGISVPSKYQTTKESISKVLAGFEVEPGTNGIRIYRVFGWDYASLLNTYLKAAKEIRETHVPCVIHVIEMCQPQGHSTSGSHERYKSKERLTYEESIDPLTVLRRQIIEEKVASEEELSQLEAEAKTEVESTQKGAWEDYLSPLKKERKELNDLLTPLLEVSDNKEVVNKALANIERTPTLNRRVILSEARKVLFHLRNEESPEKDKLIKFSREYHLENNERYSSHLLSETERSPLVVDCIEPVYSESPEEVDGRIVIQRIFDHHLGKDPRLFIIGEDVGKLGGVNLEFDGLSDKYGDMRVTDTGIREATILGQGIGAAIRGLKPIVDIQYLDYLLYAFQIMSDDLATLHYRTAGGQIAPVIVRTKGDRLEGVWHTGSPMGTIINGIRGMHVCVPRDMVQAAGMYNTLLENDDPALVVEVLCGYRVKEKIPDNLTDFKIPLGVPEIIREGKDVTVVTYGACVNLAYEASKQLADAGVDIELIDVRTLLPFDIKGMITKSIKKTGAVLFIDEDVPGGSSAFMMQQVLEDQRAFEYLDCRPLTLSSQPHRGAYASDGDYFSKPNIDDMFDFSYSIMHDRDPAKFPKLR